MNNLPSSQSLTQGEWSHVIKADSVAADAPLKISISPSGEEKKRLCQRLDLHGIESLEAHVTLSRNPVTLIVHVSGMIEARLTQKCIVTLDPVDEVVHEEFEAWFSDPDQAVSFKKAKRERLSDMERGEQPILEENEDPEPIIDGNIDVGEVVTQFLSLALNPYPRLENLPAGEGWDDEAHAPGAAEDHYNNPFTVLKNWKNMEKNKKEDE